MTLLTEKNRAVYERKKIRDGKLSRRANSRYYFHKAPTLDVNGRASQRNKFRDVSFPLTGRNLAGVTKETVFETQSRGAREFPILFSEGTRI